jgi:hypothetical protein
MNAGLITIAAGCVLGAHGIGHALGWMPALGLATFQGVSTRSWAVTAVIGDPAARIVAGVLFLAPMAGFLLAAGGLLTGQPWWRQAAVASAALSLLATALYPQAFSTGATVGSVAVNLVVLYGILVAGWGADAAVA